MVNRLANSTSPYLLQHADNPVDWWPWGEEAFAEAARRNVPVLISIGYSTCHWCHVMAAESFSDEATAQHLRRDYVSIKVDGEELPAVDSYYMDALQAMRGEGGWPMTIIADAQGRPFFAGTYFPPQPRQGMPSFRQVLTAISATWRDERSKVEEVAGRLSGRLAAFAQAITEGLAGTGSEARLTADELRTAVDALERTADAQLGGFGTAPKFPPLMTMMHLMRHAGRTGDHRALDMVRTTLARIAAGGIRDQLDGGISRYSVDARWEVPHFEKMLYDNALYLRSVTQWHVLETAIAARTSARAPERYAALAAREAHDTAEFLLHRLQVDGGAFASGLDADSLDPSGRAVEGFYSTVPLAGAAPTADPQPDDDQGSPAGTAQVLAHHVLAGDVEGRGVLTRPDILTWLAASPGSGGTGDGTRGAENGAGDAWGEGASAMAPTASVPWEEPSAVAEAARLRADRDARRLPHLDDKAITEWNGLAITALARAASVFDRADWLEAATAAMAALLDSCDLAAMRIPRSTRRGRPGPGLAGLADAAALGRAALALREAGAPWPMSSGDSRRTSAQNWLELATRIAQHCADTFLDATATPLACFDGEDPVLGTRTSDPVDNAKPSGRTAAAELFLLLAELTAVPDPAYPWGELADRLLGAYRELSGQSPQGCGWALFLSEHRATGPVRVAAARADLMAAALRHPAVLTVDAHGPELAGNAEIAVVCRGTECSLPLHDGTSLIAELDSLTALTAG